MKYLAVIDDAFMSNFRFDDNGLVLVVKDKCDAERAMQLMPIHRPVLTAENGTSVYLNKEHIDVLCDYEREQALKEMVKKFNDGISDANKLINVMSFKDGNIPTNGVVRLSPSDGKDGETNAG